ncbi:MAG TPA: hypothetical protein VM509_08555 [Planctomycetota bacterium]|nr:hypothetical protein [Planctomycetota bacterium]
MRVHAAITALLFVAAIFLRGIEAPRRVAPEQRAERPVLASPLQFLGPSGAKRSAELKALLPEALRESWIRSTTGLKLTTCPNTLEWLATPVGQQLERTVAELERGDSAQGLAALVLLVELARHTKWSPSLFLGPEHAERVGDLLQAWLQQFAEKSSDDPTLHEPALAAALLYARVMRAAYDAPALGRNRAPYERAKAFLRGLCGLDAKTQTQFGRALKERHPRAFLSLTEDDFLAGGDEEARLAFPDVDGACGK